jgi:hypothetical protein
MRASEIVTELFKSDGFELHWNDQEDPDEVSATAYDRQGRSIDISFFTLKTGTVEIDFRRGGSVKVTGKGDAASVLTTVLQAVITYVKKYNPEFLVFSANEASRRSLYSAMVNRIAGSMNFSVYTITDQNEREILGSTMSQFEVDSSRVTVLKRTT